jgi:hypothetical protein
MTKEKETMENLRKKLERKNETNRL